MRSNRAMKLFFEPIASPQECPQKQAARVLNLGANNGLQCGFEVRNIPRDQYQTMDLRGSGDECISRFDRMPQRFTSRHKPPTGIGDPNVDRQDSPFNPRAEILAQPRIEPVRGFPAASLSIP